MSTHFLLPFKFLMRNLLVILLGIIWVWQLTCLLLLSKFSLSLALKVFIILCSRGDLFEFIKFEVGWASRMPIAMYFTKHGKFSEVISLNNFFFFLFSFWNFHSMYVTWFDGISHILQALLIFLQSVFFYSSDSGISTALCSSPLFLPYSYSNMFLSLSSGFFISIIVTYPIHNFFLGSFLCFLSLHWYFHFAHTSYFLDFVHVPCLLLAL